MEAPTVGEVVTREEMIRSRERTLPVKWFTLVSHAKSCDCDGCKQRETFVVRFE